MSTPKAISSTYTRQMSLNRFGAKKTFKNIGLAFFCSIAFLAIPLSIASPILFLWLDVPGQIIFWMWPTFIALSMAVFLGLEATDELERVADKHGLRVDGKPHFLKFILSSTFLPIASSRIGLNSYSCDDPRQYTDYPLMPNKAVDPYWNRIHSDKYTATTELVYSPWGGIRLEQTIKVDPVVLWDDSLDKVKDMYELWNSRGMNRTSCKQNELRQ